MLEFESMPDAGEGMRQSAAFLDAKWPNNNTAYGHFIWSLEAL